MSSNYMPVSLLNTLRISFNLHTHTQKPVRQVDPYFTDEAPETQRHKSFAQDKWLKIRKYDFRIQTLYVKVHSNKQKK